MHCAILIRSSYFPRTPWCLSTWLFLFPFLFYPYHSLQYFPLQSFLSDDVSPPRCVPTTMYPHHDVSPPRSVRTTMCPHHDVSPSRCVRTTMCPHHDVSPPRCVPTTMCPHHDVSAPRCVPTTMCPHHDVSPSRCVRTTMCPHHDVSPPRCVPTTMCPHHDVSPTTMCPHHDVSPPRCVLTTMCPHHDVSAPRCLFVFLYFVEELPFLFRPDLVLLVHDMFSLYVLSHLECCQSVLASFRKCPCFCTMHQWGSNIGLPVYLSTCMDCRFHCCFIPASTSRYCIHCARPVPIYYVPHKSY